MSSGGAALSTYWGGPFAFILDVFGARNFLDTSQDILDRQLLTPYCV